MTNMAPPPPPKEKPKPFSLLELLDAMERHLDIRTAVRDVSQQEFGINAATDREIRCLELITEIIWTVSNDKDRYRQFAVDVRDRYGKWVRPSDRLPQTTEEATDDE
jgi:hypothetical protein